MQRAEPGALATPTPHLILVTGSPCPAAYAPAAHRVGCLDGGALDAHLARRLPFLARLLHECARADLLGQDVRPV